MEAPYSARSIGAVDGRGIIRIDAAERGMKQSSLVVMILGLLSSDPVSSALAPSTECLSPLRGANTAVQSTCVATEHGGRKRTARIYVGRDVSAAAPLLFVLHGGEGSASAMEQLTRGAFNRVADRDGAIVVYPEGVGRHWNDGRDLPEITVRENVDDVGFMLQLVEDLARDHALDRRRIFATGFSNGGFMSMRLACEAATTFAAVAPVTAVLSEKLGSYCKPAQPVAVAIINGTDDPLVPWQGGMVKVLGVSRGAVWSAERTFERWLELDGCSGRSSAARVDRIPNDKTSLIVHRGDSCHDGVGVRLYEIEGGGHTWPKGVAYAKERGRVTQELDATEEIWQFMQANAKPTVGKASP
jgi:polyhydroxybutyrate depolymerase